MRFPLNRGYFINLIIALIDVVINPCQVWSAKEESQGASLSAGLCHQPPPAAYAKSRLCSQDLGEILDFSPILSLSWWECPGPRLESCFGFFPHQGVFLPLHMVTYQQEQCCLMVHGPLITEDSRPMGAWTAWSLPPLTRAGCDSSWRRGKRDPGNQAFGSQPLGGVFSMLRAWKTWLHAGLFPGKLDLLILKWWLWPDLWRSLT